MNTHMSPNPDLDPPHRMKHVETSLLWFESNVGLIVHIKDYHIAQDKRPWALTAQASKFESGWLHGEGA